MNKYNQNTSNSNQIFFGILAGTVVGAIATAFINSSKGKEIRDELVNAYHDASKKACKAAQNISDRSQEFSDHFLHNNHHSSQKINFTIAAVAGSILGVSALIFLSSDASKGFREQVAHSFKYLNDKAHNLEDMAHSAAEDFEDHIGIWIKKAEKFFRAFQEKDFTQLKKCSITANRPFNKAVDFAICAAQLFQSLKK